MCFAADEISSAFGIGAERGDCGLNTTSTITCMGTGTGSQSRAWTA